MYLDNLDNSYYNMDPEEKIRTFVEVTEAIGDEATSLMKILNELRRKGIPEEDINDIVTTAYIFSDIHEDDILPKDTVQQLRDEVSDNETMAHQVACHFIISDTESNYWIHSHGMDRYGLPELEIRHVPVLLAGNAITILRTVCGYMIDNVDITDQSVFRFEKAEPIVGQEDHYDTKRLQIVGVECSCEACRGEDYIE
jgi:hypothetical protein